MISDITLINLLLVSREYADMIKPVVKLNTLTKEGKVLFEDMFTYYDQTNVDAIPVEPFWTWFHQIQHPEFADEEHKLYDIIFQYIKDNPLDLNTTPVRAIIQHYKKAKLKSKINKILDSVDFDPEDVKQLLTSDVEDDNLDNDGFYDWTKDQDIMDSEARKVGLRWRLNILNRALGSLIPGDFGIVAADVDTGKTTFLASESTFMATQFEDGEILWFTAEGSPKRIMALVHRAALNMTTAEYDRDEAAARARYVALMNGNPHKIRVYDSAGMTMDDVKRRARRRKAKFIILDPADRLLRSDQTNGKNLDLELLYNDIRELSKELCPILATSQVYDTNHKDWKTKEVVAQEFIGLHQMDWSRNAKQRSAEFVITIGRNLSTPNIRGIHTPKNKLPGDGTGKERFTKTRVVFDGDRSRYNDIPAWTWGTGTQGREANVCGDDE